MQRLGRITAVCILMTAFSMAGEPALAQKPPATGSAVSLYSDLKAVKIGDVLSVIIIEANSASKNSQTSTRKQNKAAAKGAATTGALQGLFPGIGGSMDLSDQYTGQGATARNGQLNSRMTVQVIEVLKNRDLVVEGTKTLEINEDMEVVTLSGIVRPSDISSSNTVYSYQVGNAKFTYKGTGALSQAQRPGFLTRIINWLL